MRKEAQTPAYVAKLETPNTRNDVAVASAVAAMVVEVVVVMCTRWVSTFIVCVRGRARRENEYHCGHRTGLVGEGAALVTS